AFVDIGVHQDGLVHLSQMANRFIKDPNEVVKVSQKVMVTVTEIDVARKRIALTMKTDEPKEVKKQKPIDTKFNKKVQKPEPAEDMQSKLAALKNRFK
ncbi:MAG: S1 RNA-binding domain-containing protein, partial [Daejeonella sp.]